MLRRAWKALGIDSKHDINAAFRTEPKSERKTALILAHGVVVEIRNAAYPLQMIVGDETPPSRSLLPVAESQELRVLRVGAELLPAEVTGAAAARALGGRP